RAVRSATPVTHARTPSSSRSALTRAISGGMSRQQESKSRAPTKMHEHICLAMYPAPMLLSRYTRGATTASPPITRMSTASPIHFNTRRMPFPIVLAERGDHGRHVRGDRLPRCRLHFAEAHDHEIVRRDHQDHLAVVAAGAED